ncbi:MAG: 25S rRNA (uracil2634-N3)-methyltransferase [Oleispira sp.]
MFLKPHWRILTIGDGDLSFSASLWKAFSPKQLTATVLDSQQTLENKYQHHAIEQLNSSLDQQVLFNFDITQPASWPNSWSTLNHQKFDLVIFQFPLVPSFADSNHFHKMADISINTLNRLLLRKYLIHCHEYFLDPNGEQLCYITSKDVKPYCEWNIENSLNENLDHIKYLGSMNFDIGKFSGYRIRNVDRDKHVKNTRGVTYVWSPKNDALDHDSALLESLEGKSHQGRRYCNMCKAGPFMSEGDKKLHEQTKKHRLMQRYEEQYKKHC